jgi:hypothetical protein
MALPRSVTEMSRDEFRPRRCKSDAFRGFSFIQDDFQLPDRSVRAPYIIIDKTIFSLIMSSFLTG